jgi:hypothetical protein
MNLDKAGLTPTERRMLTTVIYFGITTNVNIAVKQMEYIKWVVKLEKYK